MAVQDRLAVQVGLGAGSEGTAGGAGALCGYEATVVWGRGTADGEASTRGLLSWTR